MSDTVEIELVGDPERVERFLRRVATIRGLRVSTAGPRRVRLPAATIGETGPTLEAAAVRSQVRLWLARLDAFIPSAGLGGRPSPVWPALEDACLRRELAAARGEAAPMPLDAWIRVEVIDDERIARDGRPGVTAAASRPPSDLHPTKLDDVDWHPGDPDARERLARFIAWLIRRRLVDDEAFTPDLLAAVRAGTVAVDEVLAEVDDRLTTDSLSDAGAAIAASKMDHYLESWPTLVAGPPPTDSERQDMVDAWLDRSRPLPRG